MVVNLMFGGGNYYSSVPGNASELSLFEKKKREKNGKYTEREVKLTNLGGGSSFNINKSGDKSKVNMDNR